jgi:predicted RNA-binding protein YlqC (UPF0109 family)
MASSIDQQFIEYIVKSLVGKPDAVSIERRIDEKGVLLELSVDPEDLGRVIGKRGATAQSLRTLLRALGTKNDARYNLKIIDTGSPEDRRQEPPAQTSDDSPAAVADTPVDDTVVSDDAQHDDDVSSDEAASTDDDIAMDDEVEPAEPTTHDESNHSDLASRTRAELADLDDLDV